MCNKRKTIAFITLIITTIIMSGQLFSQNRKDFVTPKIDSILRNTLDYLEIRNSLVKQQFDIQQKEKQIGKTLSGLRLFLTLRKASMAKGGKVLLRNVAPAIKQVFTITGFSSLFDFE